MNQIRLFSIACGILVWGLGVLAYGCSFSLSLLNDLEQQANIILVLAIIPSACLGTYIFYNKRTMAPSALALTFVITATLLDILITVPVFIIPQGGSHSEFFSDPMFYTIIVEFYCIVLYYGTYLTKKQRLRNG